MQVGRRKAMVLLVAAACVVTLAGVALRQWFGARPPADIVLVGNIEAHESVLGFNAVQAPIVRLAADEGQSVAAGSVLAVLDDSSYRQQLRIDESAQQVAERQLQVNRASAQAARELVASDRLDHVEKQRELERALAQCAAGALSTQACQQAETAAGQSGAALARDRALARVAQDNVALAQAAIDQARERVAQDRITLGYTVLRAPFAGTIAVREAEPGQLAGPGVAVFTLDDLDHVWMRAYLEETDLGHVRLGQDVELRSDGAPSRVFHGRISFISPQAEFTPKTVETQSQRVTLVYRMRIDVPNPGHQLLPGMPVQASIRRLPAAR